MGLLTAVPFRKAVDSSCCTHTQAGGYVQDRWHDADALHEQRHDSPQRGIHGVCFSLCIVAGVALLRNFLDHNTAIATPLVLCCQMP